LYLNTELDVDSIRLCVITITWQKVEIIVTAVSAKIVLSHRRNTYISTSTKSENNQIKSD